MSVKPLEVGKSIIVVAKIDCKYPEYPYTNWVKGEKYPCHIQDDLLIIEDTQGKNFYFSGKARELINSRFEFSVQ